MSSTATWRRDVIDIHVTLSTATWRRDVIDSHVTAWRHRQPRDDVTSSTATWRRDVIDSHVATWRHRQTRDGMTSSTTTWRRDVIDSHMTWRPCLDSSAWLYCLSRRYRVEILRWVWSRRSRVLGRCDGRPSGREPSPGRGWWRSGGRVGSLDTSRSRRTRGNLQGQWSTRASWSPRSLRRGGGVYRDQCWCRSGWPCLLLNVFGALHLPQNAAFQRQHLK